MTDPCVLLAAYIITFLIGLPTNILAMYAFIMKLTKKPTPTDILLLNLTLSDLLFLVFLPLKIYEAASGMNWYLSHHVCAIMCYVFFTTIYVSSLLLMAISIDRYLGVAFPVTYRKFRKILYAIIGSIFIWLFSGAHCTVVLNIIYMKDPTNITTCYKNFTSQQKSVLFAMRLEFFVILFLVPLAICVFCYLNCIWILYHKPRITMEEKQRAIGMALGTLIVYLICFLPFNISHLVSFITKESPEWRNYTLLLSSFNACLDPIIFYFSSTMFRNTTKMTLCKIFANKH
ncbi:free fatty acid receptor 2-like [Clarias gariepinus]|uniref:free fatty acid receptor 2-like n=1 Tax=Clarias gariepinus TaxID=13013 RepID=UPI00234DEDE5|nr:free fatty acid receptor 2-like [Clarias gariepinus]